MRLTLQVGVVLGTDINDAFADASHLRQRTRDRLARGVEGTHTV